MVLDGADATDGNDRGFRVGLFYAVVVGGLSDAAHERSGLHRHGRFRGEVLPARAPPGAREHDTQLVGLVRLTGTFPERQSDGG